MATVKERLQHVRTKLLLTDSPKFVFMANLLQVPDVIDPSVETAATDGSSIRWNPDFVETLNNGQLLGVLVHELMHIGLLHNVVAINYDNHKLLNIAADLAVNSIIKAMGLNLPESALLPGQGEFSHLPLNQSMEAYYRALQDMDEDKMPEPQPGAVEPAGSESKKQASAGQSPALSAEMAAEIIKAMVGEALQKSQGKVDLPEVLGAAVSKALESKVDYRDVLKKYRTKLCRGGSDWTRPNRRVMASGVSIARNRTRKVNSVLVLLDCSGSMNDGEVAQCLAEIESVFGEVAGSVHVWQHDTQIVDKAELKAGQPIPEFQRKTYGGTCHRRPFAEVIESDVNPDLVICLTDCQTSYPSEWPKADVLWISTVPVSGRYVPPVGELIVIA
jgi:predicted metal-dependent peptidase